MWVRVLVAAAVGVTILQKVIGENIAIGKPAKQSTTYGDYDASKALDETYSNRGSFTKDHGPSWWEVDLRGYFSISNITLTAADMGWSSHYTPRANRKVSITFLTTSAVTAGACGILCHKSHSCIDFSYRTTASTEANCLLTYKVVPLNSVPDHAWSMYTLASCLKTPKLET